MVRPSRLASGDEDDALSVIIRSQRILLRGVARKVRSGDLTLQQAAVLRILVKNGPTAMNKLSQELLVTPPNVTGIVDRLEERGLVVRVASEKDRRATEIKITSRGEALKRNIREDYKQSLGRSLEALTEDERATLARLLKKLADQVEASSRASPSDAPGSS